MDPLPHLAFLSISWFFIGESTQQNSCGCTLFRCEATILDPQQANQPISMLYFFNPQQILLLRDRLITQVEKTRNNDPKLATKQCCATS